MKKSVEDQYNTFEISVLKIFANSPFESYNYKQVSSRMGIYDKAGRELLHKVIEEFVEKKVLEEKKRGKYQLNSAYISDDILPKNEIIGTIDMKQTGKAYVIPENGLMDDVFVTPNNTNHALHGDKVKVSLFPQRKGRKPEGQVVEILQRGKTKFVGKVQVHERVAFLIPDNRNMPIDILIQLSDLNGAKTGDKAIAEIIEWNEHANNPFGRIVKVLGKPGNNEVEMHSILAEFDFSPDFPSDVEKAANKISLKIPQTEISARRDFRDVETFTIDPADAKDFDDALSYRILKNGNYEVGVHIADVSYYVEPDSIIDQEAYNRGTSVYLVDRTVPMLPEILSNGVCSLRPNEEKLCFSAVFEMNDKAEILNQWIGKTVIKSDRRFAYEEAQKIIEGEDDDYKEAVLQLHNLASILRRQRYDNGAINFESKEVKFLLDENAKPIGVYIKEQKEANFLIEEFMLLANRRVSEFVGRPKGKEKPKTFIYRVHDEPIPEKLNTFVQFVSKLGYKMKIASRKSLADSFNRLFADIAGKGEENMIDTIAIRTMAKAYYSTENIGHYGLGFSYYSHFTSPIRRYPDLMVHRLLNAYLHDEKSANAVSYEEKCKHSSQMERKAAEAERNSIKYKQAEYLSERIGQVFEGKISGVSKWGIYVELNENFCEGMIPLGSLNDDYYYLDEDNYQVIGRRYHKQYKLGDPITIRIANVDLFKKQMDFEYVDTDISATSKSRKPSGSKAKSTKGKSGEQKKKSTKTPSRKKR